MTLFRLQSVVCPHSTPEPTKSNQNKGNQLNKCNNISLNVLEFVKDKLAVFYLLFNKQVFVICNKISLMYLCPSFEYW